MSFLRVSMTKSLSWAHSHSGGRCFGCCVTETDTQSQRAHDKRTQDGPGDGRLLLKSVYGRRVRHPNPIALIELGWEDIFNPSLMLRRQLYPCFSVGFGWIFDFSFEKKPTVPL